MIFPLFFVPQLMIATCKCKHVKQNKYFIIMCGLCPTDVVTIGTRKIET